ncbi:hypothetical protein LCGC14_1639440 [marine sediment metagenome]|uniref:MalT-like TPR region domain-containing protein n=1 Tax=marine sediment metagenome TaxID=412755 RepID=A0A0F9KZN2_9ZZZZ
MLIHILIEKGDIDQAKLYLQHLEGMSDQLAKDKKLYLFYLFSKAIILKTSLRTLDLGKAEELLRQILEDEDADYSHLIRVLPKLCELLLIELRTTNNLEVLEEIEDLVAQLLDIAENMHSFSLLCEAYLLKA